MTALLAAAIAVTASLALRSPNARAVLAGAALLTVAVAASHGYGADLFAAALFAGAVTLGTIFLLHRQVVVIWPRGTP